MTAYTTISSGTLSADWPENYGSSGTLGIFCTENFTADNNASFIAGDGDSLRSQFVTESAITVASGVGTYASYLLPKTDTCTPNTIRYFGRIFDSRGTGRDFLFEDRHLRSSLGDSISELQWAIDNNQNPFTQTDTKPTTDDMNAAIAAAILNAALNQDYVIGAYSTFAEAIAAMPVTGATLVINQTTSVPTDTTVPSYVTLKFTGKGYVNLTTGVTLTILGTVEAGHVKIFYNALNAQGTVSFAGNAVLPEVYPEWWATNTTPGTTDMTDAINAAWTAAPTGSILLFTPASAYKITSAIAITKSLTVRGYGATLDISALGTSAKGLSINGSATATPSASATLTALAVNGATSLTVDNITNFGAGDLVEITSTERFTVGGPGSDADYKKGELAFVESVSAGTINLRSALKEGYAVAGQTVTITKTTPLARPRIEGLKIVGDGLGVTQQVGLDISYAIAPIIQDVSVVSCGGTGMNFTAVDHGTMVNNYVENVNDITDVTGYAYSFSRLTQHSTVTNCRARRSRHGFTTGSYYPVWFYTVIGCAFADGVDNVSAGILTHLNGSDGLLIGNTIDNMALGITVLSQRNVVSSNIITNAAQQGITVGSNASKQTLVIGNKITAAFNAIVTVAYDGGTQPNVDIRNNMCIGLTIGGTDPSSGIASDTDYANIANNTIRGFGPGIRAAGNYQNIENNDVLDVLNTGGFSGTAIRVFTSTTVTGVRVRNNRVKNDTGSGLVWGILVDSGAVDTLLESDDVRNAITANILDSGTRTVMKRLIIEGRLQTKSLVTGTAGLTNATTAGKIKTVNSIIYELFGTTVAFNATDNFWGPTVGATTSGTEFRKILLGIDSAAAAVIIYGQVAASQAAAIIPNWDAYNVCPVGYVEIPNNYTDGGSLAGFTFRDYTTGKLET